MYSAPQAPSNGIASSVNGILPRRRTSLSQQSIPNGLHGPFKDPSSSTTTTTVSSPERRMVAAAARSTPSMLSHRQTDSLPASPEGTTVTTSPHNRTPERRPPFKTRRSSYGSETSPSRAKERPLPAPATPPPVRRAVRIRRRHFNRYGLLLVLALSAVLLYRTLSSRPSSTAATGKKPSKRKKAKPIDLTPRNTSHTHLQLANLRSTLAQPHTATVAAFIVCDDQQTVNLRPLLTSLETQSLAPSEAVVLCELETSAPLSTAALPVSVAPSNAYADPVLDVLLAARQAHTDFLFIVDASTPPLSPEHLDTLVHAAGTVEYSAALLTSQGIAWTESDDHDCLPRSDAEDGRASAIHLPSAPYLVQRTWLTTASDLESGLRLDLPHGHALALSLWRKAGINAFALPMADAPEFACDEHKLDPSLASSFLAERAVTAGTARTSEEYLEAKATGIIAFVVADAAELKALGPLACAAATGGTAIVVVLLREGYVTADQIPCYLDVRKGTSYDAAIADVIFYTSDRAATSADLRAINAWTADYRGTALAAASGPTAIRVPIEAVAELDWAATLDIDALKSWHRVRIDMAVITNNRPESFARLLRSLIAAEYYGDHPTLSISLEQTADAATQRLIQKFDWPHGTLHVRHRVILGGLMPAITEAWYPSSNDSYGVFLEDDVELSPLFYGWLKFTILKYRYSGGAAHEQSNRLYGVSLYQQRAMELRPEGRKPFDAHALFASFSLPPSSPYLSQVPCSWGAVYFPEVWREFHHYLALRLSEVAIGIAEQVVPDTRSNRWPRSWKKYFIELVYIRGYSMLYPNYPDWMSFSTNHLEKGTHVRSVADFKRKQQFEVPLVPRSSSLLDGLPNSRLPGWPSLPVLDLWGGVTTESELISRGWSTMRDLGVCPIKTRPPDPPTFDARELLCERKSR